MICDEVHLLNLTVHPDFRRCGTARELITFLICFSRRHGAKWIDLEVRRSNSPALRIYRAFGFREKAVRRGYYPDNREDAVIMKLEFDDESNSQQTRFD
jgi:ribosomal-protein-alanine N-acetyltransferase